MLGPTASGEPAARLAGWHLSIRLLRLGLLTRPFNAATGIDGLRRRHLRLLLPHFLNALPGYLVKSVILHRRDQELGQPPYQSIDTVWRVAGARPIEIAREGAHLVLQLGKGADVVDPVLFHTARRPVRRARLSRGSPKRS